MAIPGGQVLVIPPPKVGRSLQELNHSEEQDTGRDWSRRRGFIYHGMADELNE